MATRGRPAVLDEYKKREIIAIVSLGGSRARAARYVGCAPSTLAGYMVRDPDFAGRVIKAEEGSFLESVRQEHLLPNSWRASARELEATWPERYGEPESSDWESDLFEYCLHSLIAMLKEQSMDETAVANESAEVPQAAAID